MQVQDVMSRPVRSISPTATVAEAVRYMLRARIGSLVVFGPPGVAGIVTERDILRKVVARRRDPDTVQVQSIMTRQPATVAPDAPLREAAALMVRRNIRRLPVVQKGTLMGILTSTDIVAAEPVLEEQTLRRLAALGRAMLMSKAR
ncbi:MAG: CBS domain-containing protein [Euryarchaeota archaeon]|nr:CBS domain-containing protein [Euryarchaeota archaeon]